MIPVVSVQHLMRLKKAAGRPQDLADIEALEALGSGYCQKFYENRRGKYGTTEVTEVYLGKTQILYVLLSIRCSMLSWFNDKKETNGACNKKMQRGMEATEALSTYIQFLLCVLCGKF